MIRSGDFGMARHLDDKKAGSDVVVRARRLSFPSVSCSFDFEY